jgi:hypothetical protein
VGEHLDKWRTELEESKREREKKRERKREREGVRKDR